MFGSDTYETPCHQPFSSNPNFILPGDDHEYEICSAQSEGIEEVRREVRVPSMIHTVLRQETAPPSAVRPHPTSYRITSL
jgi:hypothetical protein